MTEENTNSAEIDRLVAAYIRNCLEGRREDFWAWEDVNELCHENPQEGWLIILRLLDYAPSKHALSCIAASPLENMVRKDGSTILLKIEKECKTNKRLLYALTTIYPPQDPAMAAKLEEILNSTKQELKTLCRS